ncbi:hypothetical protein AB0P17_06410 [Streptomyces sp. NPDC088124]
MTGDGDLPAPPAGSRIDTEAHRPSDTDNSFNAWTTLTHADNPA